MVFNATGFCVTLCDMNDGIYCGKRAAARQSDAVRQAEEGIAMFGGAYSALHR